MLIKNTFFSFINSTLRFLSTAILYIILARALGVEEFGRFTFALTFTGIFLTFIDYGFNLLVVKEVSQNPEKKFDIINSIINAKIIITLFFTIILAVSLRLFNYPDETKTIIYILWISVIFYSFGYFFNNVFRGLNNFQCETYPTIVLNAIQFILVTAFLLIGFMTLSVATAYLIGRVVYFIYSYWLIKAKLGKLNYKFNYSRGLINIKVALPYGIHAILGALYFQIDTIFLSHFKGNTDVGFYQAGMRLVMASMIVYEVITSAFFPVIASTLKTDIETFKKNAFRLNRYMILIGAIIGMACFLYSDLIIQILYGKEYLPAGLVLKLLGIVIFLRFLGAGYAMFITVAEGQKYRAIGVSVSVGVSIIVNLILIPRYGAIGAAVASIITHIVLDSIYFYFSLNLTNSVFIDRYLTRGIIILLLSLILFIVPLQIISVMLFICISLFAIVFSLVKEERERMRFLIFYFYKNRM